MTDQITTAEEAAAVPPPKPPRYSRPRTANKNWSRTKPGLFARCVIVATGRAHGCRGKGLYAAVLRIIPLETFREIFPGFPDVSVSEVQGRYHTGTAPKYEREHPDKHPVGAQYYPAAVEAVERGEPLTFADIQSICEQCDAAALEAACAEFANDIVAERGLGPAMKIAAKIVARAAAGS